MTKKERFLKKLSQLDINLHDDHALPSNRRDFLASGLISMSTMAIAGTSLFGSKSTYSAIAECQDNDMCGIPFLSFEGAGGMNIPGGNVMVGFGADEDQKNFGSTNLADYIRLGIPPSMHPSRPGMLNENYGLVFHSTSGILQGLEEALAPVELGDPDYRRSIDGLVICARTGDDSADNPINAAFQAAKAGAHGKLVQLVGSNNSANGARSKTIPSQVDLKQRASRISNFNDGEGLLSLGGDIMGADFLDSSSGPAGTSRVKAFLQKIISMGEYDLDKIIAKRQETNAMKEVLNNSKGLFDKFSPNSLNPTRSPAQLTELQQAFGGDPMTTDVVNENVASVANLVTSRVSGVGSIVVGGCDYHNGTAARGQMKDKEIGRHIGKCIKLAALRGKDLFIHLYTDGGVTGPGGGTTDETEDGAGRVLWASDSGTRSAQMILVYKHGHNRPANGPLLLSDGNGSRKRQIGYFNKGGGINLGANSISNSVENIWKVVILNYLAAKSTEADEDKMISDVIEEFQTRFPRETLPDDAASLIRLKPLRAA